MTTEAWAIIAIVCAFAFGVWVGWDQMARSVGRLIASGALDQAVDTACEAREGVRDHQGN
jgi:phosphate/sulfate permease